MADKKSPTNVSSFPTIFLKKKKTAPKNNLNGEIMFSNYFIHIVITVHGCIS